MTRITLLGSVPDTSLSELQAIVNRILVLTNYFKQDSLTTLARLDNQRLEDLTI
jgi:hypothetical protein